MRELLKLTAFLRARGAIVLWVRLPDAEDGAKQGIDDWLLTHALEELEALLVEPAEDPLVSAPRDDIGNGLRLAYLHGDHVRWVIEHKTWACWDGQRWDLANPQLIVQRAKETVRSTQIAIAQLPGTYPNRDDLVDLASKMGSRYRLEVMIEMACGELAIRADAFDADPWLLNCLTGTVDLTTGLLRPPAPGDLITKLVPFAYEPEATCPEFERFVADVLNGNPELIGFMHRALGYSLTGQTNEQTYFVLTGDGGNGKGLLIRLITYAISEYTLNLPAAALHRGRNSSQGFDVADLPGKRFVTSSETTTTSHLDEQRIKALTGAGTVHRGNTSTAAPSRSRRRPSSGSRSTASRPRTIHRRASGAGQP